MRALAYVILVTLAVVIGYSAHAQQASSSRLNTSQFQPALVAQAQPQPGVTTTLNAAPAAPMGATAEPAPAAVPVDETALRYFARQGDTVRVQAEIERLRSLHPGWEPPTNLLSDEYVPDPDIIRIWELFSNGDFAGARAAVATKQQADPSFVPSEDLLKSLALGEAGLRLRTASDAKQYETVISIAANAPDLLTCESVDNLWRLAEAFARSGNTPRAVDAYSYVLSNCEDSAQRYATLQKAIDVLDRADLDPLLALERTGADGVAEFAELRLDLARRSIAAALGEDGVRPPAEDVTLFETAAETGNDAADMRLMGWYELSRDRHDAGRRWFEKAVAIDPSVESVQGLGTALLDLGDPEAAEEALSQFRDDGDEITALYLDAAAALLALQPRITLENRVLDRIVESVMDARQANAAQELGWYAYDFQQPQTALEWFTLAIRWQSNLEPAAYGMMVAANALGDQVTVESIRTQWGPRSERIANFGRTGATVSAAVPLPQPRPVLESTPARVAPAVQITEVQAAPAAQGSSGSQSCAGFVPAGSLSAGGALSHGWCLMELNRPAQAVDHFTRALQSGAERTRSQAAYGLSLAYVRLGLADEAAVAAAAAPISDRQAVELEVAILSQKATSAYNVGDYRRALDAMDARARFAPERNDLLTLRAWSYYHLRRYREAQRIFEAVAATGYGDAVEGLAATKAAISSE